MNYLIKLVNFEIYLQRDEQHVVFVAPVTANMAHRIIAHSNRSNQPQAQSRKPSSSTSDSTRPISIFQYHDKRGHTAKTCY
jgi:hypothetical protein